MRKLFGIVRKIIGTIGMILVLAALVAAFVAYFIYHTDPVTNIMYDGFGRQLSESPFFVRWAFGQDRLWVGWFWFIADMIIFWGGFLLAYLLTAWGFDRSDSKDELETTSTS